MRIRVGAVALVLATALALTPAYGSTAGASGGTILHWAHKYRSQVSTLATVGIVAFSSGNTQTVAGCRKLERVVKRDSRIPPAPGAPFKTLWRSLLRQFGAYAKGCVNHGSAYAPSIVVTATKAVTTFGELIEHLELVGAPLAKTIAAKLASSPTSQPQTAPKSKTSPTIPLAIGKRAVLDDNGKPWLAATAVKVDNPAEPSTPTFDTVQTAGDIFVAVEFTFSNLSAKPTTTDVYADLKIYDSAGQGFTPSFSTTSAGAGFPSGEVSLAPGGTASGWVMFEVPDSPLSYVAFTPVAGSATQATAKWAL